MKTLATIVALGASAAIGAYAALAPAASKVADSIQPAMDEQIATNEYLAKLNETLIIRQGDQTYRVEAGQIFDFNSIGCIPSAIQYEGQHMLEVLCK